MEHGALDGLDLLAQPLRRAPADDRETRIGKLRPDGWKYRVEQQLHGIEIGAPVEGAHEQDRA